MVNVSETCKPSLDQLAEGNRFHLYVNRRWRPARVLAILRGQVLIEYEMSRTTALRVFDLATGIGKNMDYELAPNRLLTRMMENGIGWIGCPQRQNQEPYRVAQPADLFYARPKKGKE